MDPHRPYGVDVENPAFGEPADSTEIRSLMSKAGIKPVDITDAERNRLIDLYDSDIRYTSEHLSRLFDEFQDLGIWSESAFVFTADHGEEFGEHGYYYHRNRPYDELISVPLIVRHPETAGERVVEEQRELLGVAPTICGWHDVDVPEAFRGRNLFGNRPRNVVATGSFVEQDHVVAGRWNDWKYIKVGGDVSLFNLETDPGETENWRTRDAMWWRTSKYGFRIRCSAVNPSPSTLQTTPFGGGSRGSATLSRQPASEGHSRQSV